MKKKCIALFIAVFVFQTGRSFAQIVRESMMDEISYVYLEKLIAVAKENYPRVNSFKSRLEIAKSNLTSHKSAWADGLSFNYVYKPNNTLDIVNPTFFNGYQVAVAFSVTELFQKASNVRQAKEAVKIAQYDQQEYNLTIESEVKRRYFIYIAQKTLLNIIYNTYSDAKNLNTDLNIKYRRGEATFTEYLQAQTAFNDVTRGKIGAELDFQNAKTSLEEMTVKKLEEIQ